MDFAFVMESRDQYAFLIFGFMKNTYAEDIYRIAFEVENRVREVKNPRANKYTYIG